MDCPHSGGCNWSVDVSDRPCMIDPPACIALGNFALHMTAHLHAEVLSENAYACTNAFHGDRQLTSQSATWKYSCVMFILTCPPRNKQGRLPNHVMFQSSPWKHNGGCGHSPYIHFKVGSFAMVLSSLLSLAPNKCCPETVSGTSGNSASKNLPPGCRWWTSVP